MIEPNKAPSLPVLTITAKRWPGLGLRELYDSRGACFALAGRGQRVRYRQTYIGLAWVIIQPLVLGLTMAVFFGFLRPPIEGKVPWSLYYISALAVWGPLMRVITQGAGSIVGNGAIVGRIYLPRVFLPLSAALGGLVDLAAQIPVIILLLIWFGYMPGPSLLLVPVMVLVGFVTATGMAMWLSALNAVYRDVQVVLTFAIQTWFFMTPILYSPEIIPADYQPIYYLNPMAAVITGVRSVLVGTPPPPAYAWLLAGLVGVFLLLTGYVFFRFREATFADTL